MRIYNKKYIWKHNILFLSLFVLFSGSTSCQGKTKQARDFLVIAKNEFKSGNYESAKSNIDSIKIANPKAFKEIKEGFKLLQEVRMAENKRNITFIDSMMELNYIKLSEHQRNFDFVRDKNYQEFGNYIPKSTPFSNTIEQNTLRSGVSEKGILFLESVISGSNLNHTKIKVSITDGSYAETLPVTADGLNYRFQTLQKTYEIVRFIGNDENGVAEFIFTFKDNPITLSYIGNRTTNKQLTKTEKAAIAQSYELSTILYEIEDLKHEKGKTEALLRYLEKKRAANN